MYTEAHCPGKERLSACLAHEAFVHRSMYVIYRRYRRSYIIGQQEINLPLPIFTMRTRYLIPINFTNALPSSFLTFIFLFS